MHYRITIVLSLLTLTALLAGGHINRSRAQIDPTDQQRTLEASVNELFTQTAQAAQATPDFTRTVEALFSSAQTATVQAQITPSPMPTPTALSVAGLRVMETIRLDLVSGPGLTSAFLAPNGEYFAHFNSARDAAGWQICLYDTAGGAQIGCVALPEPLSYEAQYVRWSPDSRYLVFIEPVFRQLIDSDLWVFDAETLTLTNWTPDEGGRLRLEDADAPQALVDFAPAFTADSRLHFIRSLFTAGKFEESILYQLDAPEGEPRLVSSLPASDRMLSTDLLALHERTAYVNVVMSGGWSIQALDLDSGQTREVSSAEGFERAPRDLNPSPDGRFLLVPRASRGDFVGRFEPPASYIDFIRVEDGLTSLIDPERFVEAAGWSPSGSAVAYLVRDIFVPENDGLYLTEAPGTPGRLVLSGQFLVPQTQQERLLWGANNTILLTEESGSRTLIVRLGYE